MNKHSGLSISSTLRLLGQLGINPIPCYALAPNILKKLQFIITSSV